MKPRSASLAVLLLAGALGTSPAAAFQETGPRPQAAPSGTSTQTPGLTFDLERKEGNADAARTPRREKSGFHSLGVLPKTLNFGLELLYGTPEPDGTSRLGIDDLTTDDMTIRGTIKRRF